MWRRESSYLLQIYSILPGSRLLGEVWSSVMRLDAWRIWSNFSRSSRRFWRSLASSLGANAVSTRFFTSLVVHSVVGRSHNLCWEDVESLSPVPGIEDNVAGVCWAEFLNVAGTPDECIRLNSCWWRSSMYRIVSSSISAWNYKIIIVY